MNHKNNDFIYNISYSKINSKDNIMKQYEFPAIETSISTLKLPSDSSAYIDNCLR